MPNSFANFERDLKRQVQKVADKGVRDAANTAQKSFDSVFAAHKFEPVEDVIPHMREAFRRADLKPDDEAEVRRYAQSVTDGERIVVKVGDTKIKW